MTDGGYTRTEAWNLQLQAKVDHLQALNKELVEERDRLREFVGAFCVASANLNENRREPYWLALMHIHDMAQLVLSRAKDS